MLLPGIPLGPLCPLVPGYPLGPCSPVGPLPPLGPTGPTTTLGLSALFTGLDTRCLDIRCAVGALLTTGFGAEAALRLDLSILRYLLFGIGFPW